GSNAGRPMFTRHPPSAPYTSTLLSPVSSTMGVVSSPCRRRKSAAQRTPLPLARLGAVRVEDAQPGLCLPARRRLQHQHLVAADAEAAIREAAARLRRERERPIAAVQHHEIVAESVHLGELEVHRRVFPRSPAGPSL